MVVRITQEGYDLRFAFVLKWEEKLFPRTFRLDVVLFFFLHAAQLKGRNEEIRYRTLRKCNCKGLFSFVALAAGNRVRQRQIKNSASINIEKKEYLMRLQF